jgi:hypothetical protein
LNDLERSAFGLLLFLGGVSAAKGSKATKVTGEVTAVDAAAMTVSLKDKGGKEVMLHVSEKAQIKKGKEDKKLADIAAGAKLKATYLEEGGKNEAQKIQIQ